MPPGYYRVAAWNGPVGQGVAGSWNLQLDAIGKRNGAGVPYGLANEHICAQIGQVLGLPLPPCGFVEAQDGSRWFASMNFNLTGNALPPAQAQQCVTQLPDLSTGVLLFDILIANSDRHPGNLSLDVLAQPAPRMSIFDHGHALLGSIAGQGLTRLQVLRDLLGITGAPPTQGNRHFLLDVLATDAGFQRWLDRIGQLPDFVLEGTCDDPDFLGITQPEASAAVDFLKHRRDHLVDIVRDHRAEFHGITTWGLFP